LLQSITAAGGCAAVADPIDAFEILRQAALETIDATAESMALAIDATPVRDDQGARLRLDSYQGLKERIAHAKSVLNNVESDILDLKAALLKGEVLSFDFFMEVLGKRHSDVRQGLLNTPDQVCAVVARSLPDFRWLR
jgi:hypothetical protein